MKRYETYKPSGIEWLGEIPENWVEKRVKEIGNVVLGKMLCNNPLLGYSLKPYLKSKNIGWIKVNTDSVEEMYFSDAEMKQYKVKKDDLLLSEGGEVGKTCIWNNEILECYIQNSVHKITFPKNVESRYYLYFSFATGVLGGYDSIVNFISIKHLTYEKLNRVLWAVPPFNEQTNIANYLDTKTTAIDSKIELLTAKAAKYKALRRSLINETVCRGLPTSEGFTPSEALTKMKNSGVEWIGKIPEHWDVKRVKEIFRNTGSGTTPPSGDQTYYDDNGSNWLQTGDLNDSFITETSKKISQKAVAEFSTLKRYPKNSLVIAMYGATIGKMGYLNIDTTTNQACCVLTNPIGNNSQYLFYQLLSMKQFIISLSTGGGQPNINQDIVRFLRLCVPDLKEQTAIANYLDEKTTQIDTIFSNINEQITKLTQLRKTLINDVVTGKIKVT